MGSGGRRLCCRYMSVLEELGLRLDALVTTKCAFVSSVLDIYFGEEVKMRGSGAIILTGGVLTILIVPSHELEANVSLETRFHDTAYTSRLCSFQDCTGNSFTLISNSFTEPSPDPTTN
jgi:hypothetical protein